MLRILLVDDEPLVLIGLQGMLEWEKLGYTVCGTARNGKLALELIEREKPDIVIADVKMPVMDGLTLAHTCRERSALPAFIMLTSFEEFNYIKQAMGAGVVDYLVKLDLTPENLKNALARAAEKVKKERALLGEVPVQENLAESVRSYRERFFVRLYAGLFSDERSLEQPLQHMDLGLASDTYLVASCEIIANTELTPAQQLKLSFSCGRMLETTLQNYLLLCGRGGCTAGQCVVLPDGAAGAKLPGSAAPAAGTCQPDLIQLFHSTAALGGGTPHRLAAGAGALLPRKRPPAAPAHGGAAHPVRGGQRGRCHRQKDAGGGTGAGVYQESPFGKTDTGRCGGGVQLFAQLPQPAFRKIRRQRLCGVHHRDPHCRRQGDAGAGRPEGVRDRGKAGLRKLVLFFQGVQKGHGSQPREYQQGI